MSVQNLRNKYYDHPAFSPLINYCDDKGISFEVMKETFISKEYKVKKIYYMKIEDVLITSYVDANSWNNIAFMLAKAYTYLGLEIPACLEALVQFFNGKNFNI